MIANLSNECKGTKQMILNLIEIKNLVGIQNVVMNKLNFCYWKKCRHL